MLIRNLRWRDVPIWPPEWWVSDHEAGEEGVLEEVRLCEDLSPACISVIANHLGYSRRGVILLEDHVLLRVLHEKLRENIGRPLTEIGNLELGLLPSLRGPKQAKPRQPSRSPVVKKSLNS
jgi:hypothetical protein